MGRAPAADEVLGLAQASRQSVTAKAVAPMQVDRGGPPAAGAAPDPTEQVSPGVDLQDKLLPAFVDLTPDQLVGEGEGHAGDATAGGPIK